ncbi:MAG: DUF3861 domain-containing protein [Candidatus Paracaedibacteraceae bacterium]|nr:DUF3861 domain-containing protein [Candidatus Paracaedibacteraceae bacterium]
MQSLKGHHRVTLDHLEPARPDQPVHPDPLIFETVNHDDLFNVVEKVRTTIALDKDEAASLAVGLKLLSEVVLRHRTDPFYVDLFNTLSTFIDQIKTAQQNKDV